MVVSSAAASIRSCLTTSDGKCPPIRCPVLAALRPAVLWDCLPSVGMYQDACFVPAGMPFDGLERPVRRICFALCRDFTLAFDFCINVYTYKSIG